MHQLVVCQALEVQSVDFSKAYGFPNSQGPQGPQGLRGAKQSALCAQSDQPCCFPFERKGKVIERVFRINYLAKPTHV